MYAQGGDYFIECDAWIPRQFKHVFDAAKTMTIMPTRNTTFPINFFFRIVAMRNAQTTEIIHLPGGLVLKHSILLDDLGLSIGIEETIR